MSDVESAVDPEPAPSPSGLVVIGNFDGVHRGHHYVLKRAAERARAHDLCVKVLTFDPHPRRVVKDEHVPVLTATARKRRLLLELGLDLEVVVYPFTETTARLSPEEFCREILAEQLQAREVVVGENFRFARDRSGDLSSLAEFGQKFGFAVGSEQLMGDSGGAFSSTRIRKALGQGDLATATAILGRPHLVCGRVARGDQRGRTLGFPTANLTEVQEILPKEGVYCAFVYDLEDGARFLAPAAVNLGGRPTVDRPHAIEAHLIGFSGDLYGRNLALEWIAPVRAVEKFNDVGSLREQIVVDVAQAQTLLSRTTPSLRAPGFS